MYESEYYGGNYSWGYRVMTHKRGLAENIAHVASMVCSVLLGTLQIGYGGSAYGGNNPGPPTGVLLTLSYRG
jgi:hypothetical protein